MRSPQVSYTTLIYSCVIYLSVKTCFLASVPLNQLCYRLEQAQRTCAQSPSRSLACLSCMIRVCDRPPVLGACPVPTPFPQTLPFNREPSLGLFHVGLIFLSHLQILNKTGARLKHICCRTVQPQHGEEGSEGLGASGGCCVCGQKARVYTPQTQMLTFDGFQGSNVSHCKHCRERPGIWFDKASHAKQKIKDEAR